jgi:hypothetical protein
MAANGVFGTLAESNGWQKPAAKSKFRCLIIKIGTEAGFGRLPCESRRAYTGSDFAIPARPGRDGTFRLARDLC